MIKRTAAVLTAATGAFALGAGPALAATDSEPLSVDVQIGDECGTATVTYENPNDFAFWGDYRLDSGSAFPDSEAGPKVSVDDDPSTYRDSHNHEVTPEQELTQGDYAGQQFGYQYNPVLIPSGETVTETVELEESEDIQARIWRGPNQAVYVPWTDKVAAEPCQDDPEPELDAECSEEEATHPENEPELECTDGEWVQYDPDGGSSSGDDNSTGSEDDESTGDPTNGSSSGDESNDEDESDSWTEWIDELDSTPDGVEAGQSCSEDDLYSIYAHTENSVIQCQPDGENNRWTDAISAPDHLMDGPGSDESSEEVEIDPVSNEEESNAGGNLPVTGASVVGLVGAGIVIVGGGGAAVWMSTRHRKTALDNEADTR